jgi:hypothetical protein
MSGGDFVQVSPNQLAVYRVPPIPGARRGGLLGCGRNVSVTSSALAETRNRSRHTLNGGDFGEHLEVILTGPFVFTGVSPPFVFGLGVFNASAEDARAIVATREKNKGFMIFRLSNVVRV